MNIQRKQPVHVCGVSKTRPNMALSVRQINERFVQGKSIPQAKSPIHEPRLDNLRNPMRQPYCDLVDVAAYNEELSVRLNKSENLLTEKQKEFLKNKKEFEKQSYDSLVESLAQKFKTP